MGNIDQNTAIGADGIRYPISEIEDHQDPAPFRRRSFSVVGTPTEGQVPVPDGDGGWIWGDPAYVDAIDADSPLLHWLMADTGGTYADASGNGVTGTYSGATHGTGGPLGNYLTYDGVNDAGSGAVDLSALTEVTLEFWLWWNAFSNADGVLFEYTPDYNSGDGLLVNPNSSAADGFEFGCSSTGQFRTRAFARPSAAAWHHYSLGLTRTGTPSAMVDGVVQTVSTPPAANATLTNANFDSSSLFVMARNLTVAPGAGRLAGVSLFPGILPEGRRRLHYLASA